MQEPKKFKEEDCMRKQALLIAVVLLSAAFLGISQNIPKVVADIPFSFMAGGKTLPAGSYQFKEGQHSKTDHDTRQ